MEVFYSESFWDTPVINRFKYKGRGRPKLTDYMPLTELQRQLNRVVGEYIERNKRAK